MMLFEVNQELFHNMVVVCGYKRKHEPELWGRQIFLRAPSLCPNPLSAPLQASSTIRLVRLLIHHSGLHVAIIEQHGAEGILTLSIKAHSSLVSCLVILKIQSDSGSSHFVQRGKGSNCPPM